MARKNKNVYQMKKFLLLAVAAVIPVLMSAQAQINTKKVKIEDFTEKTLKVVLGGNLFFDQVFKDEVQNRWRISPFEFCSPQEFEELKTDSDYYFLLLVKGQFRKEMEPGLSMITVVKGGENASKGLNRMLDVVTVPIMSLKDPSGREFAFLPAILDILQEHILLSMEKDVAGYSGLELYTAKIGKTDGKKILFAEEDLSDEITDKVRKVYFKNGIGAAPADSVDRVMSDNTPDTIVSFTVTPADSRNGSFCYKMLIDAQTHELYYYRKHRLNSHTGPGFLLEDIHRIATR